MSRIKGIEFNDVTLQLTSYHPLSHVHFSGHSIATLTGTITNHNQNNTAGVAKSTETNTTVSLGGVASCCNLQRERERERGMILNVIVFVLRVWRRAN